MHAAEEAHTCASSAPGDCRFRHRGAAHAGCPTRRHKRTGSSHRPRSPQECRTPVTIATEPAALLPIDLVVIGRRSGSIIRGPARDAVPRAVTDEQTALPIRRDPHRLPQGRSHRRRWRGPAPGRPERQIPVRNARPGLVNCRRRIADVGEAMVMRNTCTRLLPASATARSSSPSTTRLRHDRHPTWLVELASRCAGATEGIVTRSSDRLHRPAQSGWQMTMRLLPVSAMNKLRY